jgi:hypothetical protein
MTAKAVLLQAAFALSHKKQLFTAFGGIGNDGNFTLQQHSSEVNCI